MSGSSDYPERGVPFWLPPTGTGNGLPATAWAQILHIPGRSVAGVLSMLAENGVPGFVDLEVDATGHRILTGQAGYRLWVDSHQYSRAEDLLMSASRCGHGDGPLSGAAAPPRSGCGHLPRGKRGRDGQRAEPEQAIGHR